MDLNAIKEISSRFIPQLAHRVQNLKPKKQPRIPKPKDPLKAELFQIKKDFLWRNYEGFKNWGAGLKIMGELLQLIPNSSFWKTFTLEKPFPIFWLRSEKGKAFLLQEYDKFINNQREIPVAQTPERFIIEEKIGEDIQTAAKPKTLKDFLK